MCQKAAEQGDAWVQNGLGCMYLDGNGVEHSYKLAIEWYRKAAEQGHVQSQCNLGYMYENGYGVEQNYQMAIEWYQKAAENGYEEAQNRLKLLLEKNEEKHISFGNKIKNWTKWR